MERRMCCNRPVHRCESREHARTTQRASQCSWSHEANARADDWRVVRCGVVLVCLQVALWAWDIVVDNCAICRNHIMDACTLPMRCDAATDDAALGCLLLRCHTPDRTARRPLFR